MCTVSCFFLTNVLWQKTQLYGVSLLWVRKCCTNWGFTVNLSPHRLHSWGLLPVWMRLCTVKFPFVANSLPHSVHLWGICVICLVKCDFLSFTLWLFTEITTLLSKDCFPWSGRFSASCPAVLGLWRSFMCESEMVTTSSSVFVTLFVCSCAVATSSWVSVTSFCSCSDSLLLFSVSPVSSEPAKVLIWSRIT